MRDFGPYSSPRTARALETVPVATIAQGDSIAWHGASWRVLETEPDGKLIRLRLQRTSGSDRSDREPELATVGWLRTATIRRLVDSGGEKPPLEPPL